jgi:hypothetical protein
MVSTVFLASAAALLVVVSAGKCPPVPNDVTSKPDGFGRKEGVTINYSCKGKYPSPVGGSGSITCVGGAWSGSPLICGAAVPVPAPSPIYVPVPVPAPAPAPAPAPSALSAYTLYDGQNCAFNDITSYFESAEECAADCDAVNECEAFVIGSDGKCWLKKVCGITLPAANTQVYKKESRLGGYDLINDQNCAFNDITSYFGVTSEECARDCDAVNTCVAFVLGNDGKCWLKSVCGITLPSAGTTVYKKIVNPEK